MFTFIFLTCSFSFSHPFPQVKIVNYCLDIIDALASSVVKHLVHTVQNYITMKACAVCVQ